MTQALFPHIKHRSHFREAPPYFVPFRKMIHILVMRFRVSAWAQGRERYCKGRGNTRAGQK